MKRSPCGSVIILSQCPHIRQVIQQNIFIKSTHDFYKISKFFHTAPPPKNRRAAERAPPSFFACANALPLPFFSPAQARSLAPFSLARTRSLAPFSLARTRSLAPFAALLGACLRICNRGGANAAARAANKAPTRQKKQPRRAKRQTKRHKKTPRRAAKTTRREAKGRPRLGAPRACSRYLSFRFTYSVCKISCARCEPGAPKKFLYSCITAGFSWLLRMPAFLSSSYSALARLERRSTCLRV